MSGIYQVLTVQEYNSVHKGALQLTVTFLSLLGGGADGKGTDEGDRGCSAKRNDNRYSLKRQR